MKNIKHASQPKIFDKGNIGMIVVSTQVNSISSIFSTSCRHNSGTWIGLYMYMGGSLYYHMGYNGYCRATNDPPSKLLLIKRCCTFIFMHKEYDMLKSKSAHVFVTKTSIYTYRRECIPQKRNYVLFIYKSLHLGTKACFIKAKGWQTLSTDNTIRLLTNVRM